MSVELVANMIALEFVTELGAEIENEIARDAALGDRARLGDLITSLKRVIISALISAGVDAGDLDDGLQATALRVAEKLPTWRGDGRIASWVYAVARSVGRELQRKSNQVSVDPEVAAYLSDKAQAQEARPLEDEKVALERRRFLANAVSNLPKEQAEAVSLFYYGGMKAEEIADSLGLSLNTVKSRLLRGRQSLIGDAISEGWRE